MKKMTKSAFWGITMFLGFFGLVSCSESDDAGAPNDHAVEMDVPVNFIFNVSSGMANQTRMTAEATQADGFSGNFRGITDTRILAYHLKDAGGSSTNGIHVKGLEQATRLYDLANIVGPNDITADHSTRVIELSIPNGTNALAFYGRAPRTKTHAEEGYIRDYVFEDNRADKTRFSLVPRVQHYVVDADGNDTQEETVEYKKWTQMRKLLATVLNRISSNGLHKETSSGANGPRDLRARIWWPKNDAGNYDPEGPLVKSGAETVALTSTNSNIAEVGEGNTSMQITFGTTVVGNYNATTRQLRTDVDTYEFHMGNIEWRELGNKVASRVESITPLEEILGKAYNNFTVMKTDASGAITEIRAGSAAAIVGMIEDLWTVTNQVQTAIPTSYAEALAKALAQRIFDRFYAYFTADIDSETGVVKNCKLKCPHDIVEEIRLYTDADALTTYSVLADEYDVEHINLYPTCPDLKMPAGSAQLSCTNGVFSFNETMAAYGMGMTDVSPLKYTWPAELMYFGNSPLRTSEKTLLPSNYPQTVEGWNSDPNWRATDGWLSSNTFVTPLTRSVAMKHNIHYGTALLATSIYYASDVLEDNNSTLHPGETNNMINVTDGQYTYIVDGKSENRFGGQKFELTGIVIGGQPLEVGWNFLQKTSNADNSFSYMVYDGDVPKNGGTWGAKIPGYAASKPGSAYHYTLLWDNWDKSLAGQSQNKVYVALEFRNCSGRDFWGVDNIVRDGGTFYLIGTIDPDRAIQDNAMTDLSKTDLSEGIEWPSYDIWALPPYDEESGLTIRERRVFIQGYKTVVRFGLGKKSLQNAYLTVPDMRSANISLGLSVDLEWKPGMEFDLVIGE